MAEPAVKTIRCLYTCQGCALIDRAVQVPARGEESVTVWMDRVFRPTVSRDHSRISPGCPAIAMAYVKIPIEGAEKIGGAGAERIGGVAYE